MKKKGRRKRKEGKEEDEKGDEPSLDVFARFATAITVPPKDRSHSKHDRTLHNSMLCPHSWLSPYASHSQGYS